MTFKRAGAVGTAWLIGAVAAGGPVWQEMKDGGADAGGLAEDAQATEGGGKLERIEGQTADPGFAGGDFEDMYLIRVCDPLSFLASTALVDGGGANFDTQLWLLKREVAPLAAIGLLGNDDRTIAGFRSRLLPVATDLSGASLIMEGPGVYFLAISGFPNVPQALGLDIYMILPPGTEISGPDGPGGLAPLSNWDSQGSTATGAYMIVLDGVSYATGLAAADCNDNGVADGCDIVNGTSPYTNGNGIPDECEPPIPGDIDGDGDVDVDDLTQVILGWGPCPGQPDPCPADIDGDGDVDVDDLTQLILNWG
jgi:hypothetical protein